ncbi:unnamed protein product [Trichobilharzia regenti]|nr:unnamed protein product [Trichobilharzia regenti]
MTWEQPSDQVSASGPVTNFYIEMKPTDSTRWQDVSADFTITEPHFTLPTEKMQEFVSYEFRVTAENKAGKSKPSSPSNSIELGKYLNLYNEIGLEGAELAHNIAHNHIKVIDLDVIMSNKSCSKRQQ